MQKLTTAKKKILICGASGFIGRNLWETLSAREDLEVFGTYLTDKFSDHPNLIQADLTNRNTVNEIISGYDVIIQAAAVTSGSNDIINRPYLHVTDNAIMNALLFQGAFDHTIPQVIFFSCTVMYPADLGRPIKEEDFNLNDGIYDRYFGVGWTKVYLEKLCEFYAKLGRTKFSVLRHSNIYGPYDKYDLERAHVCGATITKVMEAKESITVWGEGNEVRDLLYVSDLVSCVEKLIDQPSSNSFNLFNIGAGEGIAIKDLVQKIIDISGKKLNIAYDRSKPSIPTKVVLDCSKAQKILGWRPTVSLKEGLNKSIIWYKKNYQN